MIRSTMSVLGLNAWDDTIWDNLETPTGIDKDVLVYNLLMECAELEVLYSDPDFMKKALGMWSKKRLPVWQALQDTTTLEYSALENYNLSETEKAKELTQSNSESNGNSTTNSESKNGTVDSAKAYNETDFVDRERNTTDSLGKGTSQTLMNTSGSGSRDNDRTANRHGITGGSVQDLLKQERDVKQFSVIDYIINDFKKRFCLMIY